MKVTRAAVLVTTGSLIAASGTALPQPAKPISGSGCVDNGVEKGCLIVTDVKTKTTYNVFFEKGKAAPPGTAISFSGSPHQGPTICQQGTAINVTKWEQIRLPCDKGAPIK